MFASNGGHVDAVLLGKLAALSDSQWFMQIITENTGIALMKPLTWHGATSKTNSTRRLLGIASAAAAPSLAGSRGGEHLLRSAELQVWNEQEELLSWGWKDRTHKVNYSRKTIRSEN